MFGRSQRARRFLHDRVPGLVGFLKEHAGENSFLPTMLDVLDDETLAVVHRETGKGFEVTISGVADNFQLHVPLEDQFIGDLAEGWLLGERPDSQVVARAAILWPASRDLCLIPVRGRGIYPRGLQSAPTSSSRQACRDI